MHFWVHKHPLHHSLQRWIQLIYHLFNKIFQGKMLRLAHQAHPSKQLSLLREWDRMKVISHLRSNNKLRILNQVRIQRAIRKVKILSALTEPSLSLEFTDLWVFSGPLTQTNKVLNKWCLILSVEANSNLRFRWHWTTHSEVVRCSEIFRIPSLNPWEARLLAGIQPDLI